MRKVSILFLISLCLGLTIYSYSFADIYGADSPHSSIYGYTCDACHYMLLGPIPEWATHEPQNIDDTPYNNLCWSCHNSVIAPSAQTHSGLQTSEKYRDGDWSIECRTCHWPHQQLQIHTYGSASYVEQGNSTAIWVDTYPNQLSTLTMTGAGWEEDQYNGYYLLPNTAQPSYNYKITDTTSDTLTVEARIDLTKAAVGNPFAIYYGNYIKSTLKTPYSGNKTVRFFNNTGMNSFADGDSSTFDGICEVCHTLTTHYRNDGSGPDQDHSNIDGKDGTDCIDCHDHDSGFAHGGSNGCAECHGHDAGNNFDDDMEYPNDESHGPTNGWGTYQSHSTHTETDDDDQRGPGIYCDTCHDIYNMPKFKNLDGSGEHSLEETDICNNCHSPGGTYDGVNDPVVGVKANWSSGIYDGDVLKSGKEKWCATCHDEIASDSKVDGTGIDAPNVIGDEDGAYSYGVGWGYYKTGHGLSGALYPFTGGKVAGASKTCDDCHDFSASHIDHEPRTYNAGSDNYQAGYRLDSVDSIDGGESMDIPRLSTGMPASDFALCFKCHDSAPYLGENDNTNFKNGSTNAHEHHLLTGGDLDDRWDSDLSGSGDSFPSCPTCHNVHGSTQLAMVRDGKLINREPGLRLVYYNGTVSYQCGGPGAHDPTPQDVTLNDSTGTIWDPNSASNLCGACHGSCGWDTVYSRTPYYDSTSPEIIGVFGNVGSDTLGVRFSEPVYSELYAVGDLTGPDFTYTDAGGKTISAVSHTAGEDTAKITLSATIAASGDIGVDTLAAATSSSIYDKAINPMDTSAVTVSGDSSPPSVSSQSPANSATGITVDSNITFTLTDTASGVDWSTISIQLSGDKGFLKNYTQADTSEVTKTGNGASYDVTVDPDIDLGHGEIISVTVTVRDNAGNSMTASVWSFTTIPGGGPYTITLYPSGVASNPGGYWTVPYADNWDTYLDSHDADDKYATSNTGSLGAQLYMNIDDLTAENPSIHSLKFYAYARYVSGWSPAPPCYSGDIKIGYKTGTNTVWEDSSMVNGCPDYILVSSQTYTTDSDGGELDITDINNLQIAVERGISGAYPLRITEIYVEVTYGTTENDTTPPYISSLNPVDSATDVSIATPITFILTDSGGGIDWATFQIQFSGDNGYSKFYTDLDATEVSKNGTIASYNVTVQPDANFGYLEVITVDVDVDDNSGNSLVSPTWSFTTEEETVPVMQTLHPSGLAVLIDDSQSDVSANGGDWPDILDTNDGDISYAYLMSKFNGGGPTYGQHAAGFKVDMDDPAGMATISEVRAYFTLRFDTPGGGPPGTYDKITLIMDTGGVSEITQIVQQQLDITNYTTIGMSSATDPDGGAWELGDIQNLRVGIKLETRENVGWLTTYAWVTEVYVEVDP